MIKQHSNVVAPPRSLTPPRSTTGRGLQELAGAGGRRINDKEMK